MANELKVNNFGHLIAAEVDKLMGLATVLEQHDVRTATTGGGLRYLHDVENDVTFVAGPNALVKKSRATTKVMIANPGATRDEVLADLKEFTQELRGTVVGRSQPWVSQHDTE
ncbi:hypothetical protein PQR33_36115 [Paraburkholderia sediminicola]|uniref:hypothetical protein n=1 Tax=Paraburkholderia sediminicola TaxID=458836 RepID=UPI0038BA54D7